jgi:BirA family biotin operon repressor/biotin-[acetyl-CoA-carboxylase] ligase
MNHNDVEHFNQQYIIDAVEYDQQKKISQIEIFESLDSTNTYLLAAAKNGAKSGSICLAENQTHGRGRQGKHWFAAEGGSICCSLLWRFNDARPLTGLSIAVAIMIATALRKYGIQNGITLKWPNDVLFDGKKLAGILLESNEPATIVIGVGLNLKLPNHADDNWVSLEKIVGQHIMRNYLTGLIVNELLSQLSIYEAQGLEGFLSRWESYDVLKGKPVVMSASGQYFEGVAQGINNQGELAVMDSQGQIKHFCYGEVSVRAKS